MPLPAVITGLLEWMIGPFGLLVHIHLEHSHYNYSGDQDPSKTKTIKKQLKLLST